MVYLVYFRPGGLSVCEIEPREMANTGAFLNSIKMQFRVAQPNVIWQEVPGMLLAQNSRHRKGLTALSTKTTLRYQEQKRSRSTGRSIRGFGRRSFMRADPKSRKTAGRWEAPGQSRLPREGRCWLSGTPEDGPALSERCSVHSSGVARASAGQAPWGLSVFTLTASAFAPRLNPVGKQS